MMATEEEFIPCQVAHFRDFVKSNQCELSFDLNVAKSKVGLIYEKIQATRQRTDTVGSLLQHIVNKINNILRTRKKIDVEIEIDASLRRCTRHNQHKVLNPSTKLSNLLEHPQGIQFVIFDEVYTVAVNMPLMKELKLPPVLYANNVVQPCKFHVLYATKELCQFKWYVLRKDWIQVGDSFKYKLTDAEIGHFLKFSCVPFNDQGVSGQECQVVSETRVRSISKVPKCPFHKRHNATKAKLTDNKIRVVSYNVLSDRYIANMTYCPPEFLSIDYRKLLVAEELLGYNADIMCLQEVDSHVFASYYKHQFKDPSYSCYYHKKGNRIPEGLACIFDKRRFKKVQSLLLVLSSEIQTNRLFTQLWNLLKTNKELKESFLSQATSLQVTVLRMREEQQKIVIVANTHLFYHPDAAPIRIIQTAMTVIYLTALRNTYFNKKRNNVIVILCGDFNSRPKSEVYNFLVSGKLDNTSESAKKISGKLSLSHDLHFTNASGTPKYTNYTVDFKDCLDYIFVDKNLQIDRVVPLPSDKVLEAQGALPSRVYPSDHLSLVVDLKVVV